MFSANNIMISFVPDVTHRCPNLPDPGIGQYLTCKMLIDNGFGHNLWKRIEKERAAWVERNRAAEALRKFEFWQEHAFRHSTCLTWIMTNRVPAVAADQHNCNC